MMFTPNKKTNTPRRGDSRENNYHMHTEGTELSSKWVSIQDMGRSNRDVIHYETIQSQGGLRKRNHSNRKYKSRSTSSLFGKSTQARNIDLIETKKKSPSWHFPKHIATIEPPTKEQLENKQKLKGFMERMKTK